MKTDFTQPAETIADEMVEKFCFYSYTYLDAIDTALLHVQGMLEVCPESPYKINHRKGENGTEIFAIPNNPVFLKLKEVEQYLINKLKK